MKELMLRRFLEVHFCLKVIDRLICHLVVLAEMVLSDRPKGMPTFLLELNHRGSCPTLTDKERLSAEKFTNLICLLKVEAQ